MAHVGLHALGCLADRLSLGEALSARVPATGERAPLHNPGKVLVQTMLMLAGGGESCADIERLRCQSLLFGQVPSDSTVYRIFRRIDAATLDGLWAAMAKVRTKVWGRSSARTGTERVVLDVYALLVDIHSENKDGSAANYKRGYGFHPIFCFGDATGEALGVLLRPGNATSNNAADNLAVVDAAINQLPAGIALGHRIGDARTLGRPGGHGPLGLGRVQLRVRRRLPRPEHRFRCRRPHKPEHPGGDLCLCERPRPVAALSPPGPQRPPGVRGRRGHRPG